MRGPSCVLYRRKKEREEREKKEERKDEEEEEEEEERPVELLPDWEEPPVAPSRVGVWAYLQIVFFTFVRTTSSSLSSLLSPLSETHTTPRNPRKNKLTHPFIHSSSVV